MKFVLLPAKALREAKTRLAVLLPPAEREAFALAMYRDVLTAVAGSVFRPGVVVVTSDPQLQEEARAHRFTVVAEEPPYGLNRAVGVGTRACMAMGATAVATLLTDIPLIEATDVDALLDRARPENPVLLVSSKEGTGTNALVRTPPDAIISAFGPSSLERHLARARDKRLIVRRMRSERIEFDIDTPQDLASLARRGGQSRAGRMASDLLARPPAAGAHEA